MRFAVIPSEARNPSSIRMPRKERFLTSQTPFGMTNPRFFNKLLDTRASRAAYINRGTLLPGDPCLVTPFLASLPPLE